jgi:hypothetical protein
MKIIKVIRIVAFVAVISNLAFLGASCKKQEGEVKKEEAKVTSPMSMALPEDGFKADIIIINPPSLMNKDSVYNFRVRVRNVSNAIWPVIGQPNGIYKINLAYRWLDKNGKMLIPDGLRTPLSQDLEPNKEITLNAVVRSPDKRGKYILQFDMVQEGVAWFGDKKGSKTARVDVKVE